MTSTTAKRIVRNTTLFVATCLLLVSCIGVEFAYNQLDWYLLNRADRYLDLNSEQEDMLEVEVDKLHQWHREVQLPRYVDLLDQSAIHAGKPLTETEFSWAEEQLAKLYFELMEKAIPPVAAVLTLLDNEQIAHLQQQLAEDIEDQYEHLDYSAKKSFHHRVEKTIEQFEGGYDDLNKPQVNLIKKHIQTTENHSAASLIHRKKVNRELIALLASHPTQPVIEQHLRTIWLYPDTGYTAGYRLSLDTSKSNYYRLMTEIHSLASRSQIEYLKETLNGYSENLAELTVSELKPGEAEEAGSDQPVSCRSKRHKIAMKGPRRNNSC